MRWRRSIISGKKETRSEAVQDGSQWLYSPLLQDHFREEYDSWNCDHGQDRGQGEYLRGVGVVLFVADRHHGSGGGSRACGRDKYSLRHLKGKSHQFQDEDHHQREDEQFDCRYKIQPYIAEHFADVRLGHGESGDHHGQRGVHIRHILQGIQKDCRNPDLSKEQDQRDDGCYEYGG